LTPAPRIAEILPSRAKRSSQAVDVGLAPFFSPCLGVGPFPPCCCNCCFCCLVIFAFLDDPGSAYAAFAADTDRLMHARFGDTPVGGRHERAIEPHDRSADNGTEGAKA
jgi:hypothetical protein